MSICLVVLKPSNTGPTASTVWKISFHFFKFLIPSITVTGIPYAVRVVTSEANLSNVSCYLHWGKITPLVSPIYVIYCVCFIQLSNLVWYVKVCIYMQYLNVQLVWQYIWVHIYCWLLLVWKSIAYMCVDCGTHIYVDISKLWINCILVFVSYTITTSYFL